MVKDIKKGFRFREEFGSLLQVGKRAFKEKVWSFSDKDFKESFEKSLREGEATLLFLYREREEREEFIFLYTEREISFKE